MKNTDTQMDVVDMVAILDEIDSLFETLVMDPFVMSDDELDLLCERVDDLEVWN